MAKHENNGNCAKCEEIFNKYPGFSAFLKDWFKTLQFKHHEAHISCAGRGMIEQEAVYSRGASNARYGQSAHNYNAAIDTFRLLDGNYDLSASWYAEVIKPFLTDDLEWYGEPDSEYYERPHIQLRNWKQMLYDRELKLVE